MKHFVTSFLLTTVLILLSCASVTAREARNMKGWESYFSERLSVLDPIEGIYDLQIKTHLNGETSSGNEQVAIAHIGGNFFQVFSIYGDLYPIYFERIGQTNAYYLIDLETNHKDRTFLKDEIMFELTYQLNYNEKYQKVAAKYHPRMQNFWEVLLFGPVNTPTVGQVASSMTMATSMSGIKIFPNSTTQQAALNYEFWSGTGFAIGNGYVVTNNHVAGDAKNIKLISGEQQFDAHLVATDAHNDISIIKVDDPAFNGRAEIPYPINFNLADVGSHCFLLGYPQPSLLGNEIKYTDGTISSRSGMMNDISTYQISAPATHGNSGGPTFNDKGEVVGILSSGIPSLENVSYSIKASLLFDLLELNNLEDVIMENNKLTNLSLTEKIKVISSYVYPLFCTSRESWENAENEKHHQNPYRWNLPGTEEKIVQSSNNSEDVPKFSCVLFVDQNYQELFKVIKEEEFIGNKVKDLNDIKLYIDLSVSVQVINAIEGIDEGRASEIRKLIKEEMKSKLSPKKFTIVDDKSESNASINIHVLHLDGDGEIYGYVEFYKEEKSQFKKYLNEDGGSGKSVYLRAMSPFKKIAGKIAKVLD